MPTARIVMAEKTPDHYFDEMTEFLHANVGKALPGHEIELTEPKSEDKAELLELLKDADFLVLGGAGQRRPVDREIFFPTSSPPPTSPSVRCRFPAGSRARWTTSHAPFGARSSSV